MSESVFLVTAKYKGEDTQLGYKKNETYHLKMYRDMYFPILIERKDGGGNFMYKDIYKFISDWSEICKVGVMNK